MTVCKGKNREGQPCASLTNHPSGFCIYHRACPDGVHEMELRCKRCGFSYEELTKNVSAETIEEVVEEPIEEANETENTVEPMVFCERCNKLIPEKLAKKVPIKPSGVIYFCLDHNKE